MLLCKLNFKFVNFTLLLPQLIKNFKMKIIITAALLSFALLTGCGKKEEKTDTSGTQTTPQTTPSTTTPQTTTPTEKKETANTSTEEKKEPEKKDELRDKSGAIRVKFPAGATEVTLNGKINGFGDKVTYVFECSKKQMLLTRVSATDEKANIRIEQIISPSGKADGPFDTKIRYDLTETGDWKIVLGENQMAGNPWKGEFKLLISIF